MTDDAIQPAEPLQRDSVLDPVDRVSEVIFGLLMAMSFTGSISVASQGHEEVRTMMFAALGCNIAWGLTDAVMYLVQSAAATSRHRLLLVSVHAADASKGRDLVAEVLPEGLAEAAGSDGLERLRLALRDAAVPPRAPGLTLKDFRSALAVFLMVVLATFPVVLPFMLMDDALRALRISNGIALVMLFIAGATLARYSGRSQWLGGLVMAATGTALITAIMALGG
jgi:hypothetical protein